MALTSLAVEDEQLVFFVDDLSEDFVQS